MKKFLLLASLALVPQWLGAQSTQARRDIEQNILLSGSNYVAYVDPVEKLTPAPKGYEPFYLTHYGRHGSRWLIGETRYKRTIEVLERAKAKGKLTVRGEKLLEQLQAFYPTTVKRLGELTTVGEKQHHRIGKRLTQRFPEIFGAKNSQVEARSTVVIRCILSMAAECQELMAYNPQMRIHNDVSESFQYYLNGRWDAVIDSMNKQKWSRVFDYGKAYIKPERFWSVIMNDPDYRDEQVKSRSEMMEYVFEICTNMQSHYGNEADAINALDRDRNGLPHTLNSYSLFDLFTLEECYNLWRCNNLEWYVSYASGISPFSQRHLLENFLQTADTIVVPQRDGFGTGYYHGASLRFGHEVCVMPMASLLELGNCYPEVPMEGLDTLDRVWRNYEIFPMASNIQLVFYRSKRKGDHGILVKALLNEREVSLPVPTDNYPYYDWASLRSYYQQKLQKYRDTYLTDTSRP